MITAQSRLCTNMVRGKMRTCTISNMLNVIKSVKMATKSVAGLTGRDDRLTLGSALAAASGGVDAVVIVVPVVSATVGVIGVTAVGASSPTAGSTTVTRRGGWDVASPLVATMRTEPERASGISRTANPERVSAGCTLSANSAPS